MNERTDGKKASRRLWLWIALGCIAVSTIGSYLVQSSCGSVQIRQLKLVVKSGYEINGQMYIPRKASAKNKLPMIVLQHGSQHNLQMQDMNMVELSRRGFVVIATDAYGHGFSTPRSKVAPQDNFSNMISVVDYAISNLDFIDTGKIGIAGHSMGAAITTTTLKYYVEQAARTQEKNKIAATLEFGYDPEYSPYTFDGIADPVIADVDWGVVAGKYDEFFFRQKDVGNDPAKILQSKAALDFIHQVDPSATGPVKNGEYYKGPVNGKEHIRVFYQNPETHPQNVFSTRSSASAIDFFYRSLGVPAGFGKIESADQVWQWKQFLTCLGLAGILLFLYPFAMWIIESVPFFSELKAEKVPPAAPALKTARQKATYWIDWLLGMAVPAALAMPVMHYWIGKQSFAPTTVTRWFGEGSVNEIAGWSIAAALCLLALFFAAFAVSGKQSGTTTENWGVKTSGKRLWKSLLLAALTFSVAYLMVFVADFFFSTDYRIWLIAMKTFDVADFLFFIAYVPAFVLFYLVNSLMVNGGNRVEGMPDWLVTLLSCLANVGGILVLLAIQYGGYMRTGQYAFNAMRTINLFPFVVQVPVATIITRKYFKATGDIYLGSITVGMLYTMMLVTQVAVNTSILY